MATKGQRRRANPIRKVLGTFTLHGDDRQTKLTISQDLAAEQFPVEPGEEVTVEVVCPSDGDAFLEVHPTPTTDDEPFGG